jgi:hypothetical protein
LATFLTTARAFLLRRALRTADLARPAKRFAKRLAFCFTDFWLAIFFLMAFDTPLAFFAIFRPTVRARRSALPIVEPMERAAFSKAASEPVSA